MDGLVVTVATGSVPEAFRLKSWLDDVRELRGRSTVGVGATAIGEQGGVSDLLVVALGSGGAVSVLGGALVRWFAVRRRSHPLKLSVTNGKKSVQIEIDPTTESAELVAKILGVIDERHDGA